MMTINWEDELKKIQEEIDENPDPMDRAFKRLSKAVGDFGKVFEKLRKTHPELFDSDGFLINPTP